MLPWCHHLVTHHLLSISLQQSKLSVLSQHGVYACAASGLLALRWIFCAHF